MTEYDTTRPGHIESTVAPIRIDNIDTDQIIPARYLKVTDKSGLAEGLFANWRYDDPEHCAGDRADWVLNQPQHAASQVLVVGDNFGCGSSREHAPWALLGGGIRAVISTRFADIFRNNALKNGLLTVTVSQEIAQELFRRLEAQDGEGQEEGLWVSIDLEAQRLTLPWTEVTFDIDPFAKHCILQGVDQLGYLADQQSEIEAFEQGHRHRVDTARV